MCLLSVMESEDENGVFFCLLEIFLWVVLC